MLCISPLRIDVFVFYVISIGVKVVLLVFLL